MIDFVAINNAALARGRTFLEALIPGGKFRSLEYRTESASAACAISALRCACLRPASSLAAGVAQHVDVNLEWEAGALAYALD